MLDALKGALPVLGVMYVQPEAYALHAGVGYAAFLGHVFPVWLRFKGGKGVATALGVLVVLLPMSALAGFVIWVVVLALTRISSVGSLLGGLVAVIAGFFQGRPLEYAALGVVIFASMLFTHRGNIVRIWKRKENQV
jgi:glycerol-3-phosphate acyltransferase PlsY